MLNCILLLERAIYYMYRCMASARESTCTSNICCLCRQRCTWKGNDSQDDAEDEDDGEEKDQTEEENEDAPIKETATHF